MLNVTGETTIVYCTRLKREWLIVRLWAGHVLLSISDDPLREPHTITNITHLTATPLLYHHYYNTSFPIPTRILPTHPDHIKLHEHYFHRSSAHPFSNPHYYIPPYRGLTNLNTTFTLSKAALSFTPLAPHEPLHNYESKITGNLSTGEHNTDEHNTRLLQLFWRSFSSVRNLGRGWELFDHNCTLTHTTTCTLKFNKPGSRMYSTPPNPPKDHFSRGHQSLPPNSSHSSRPQAYLTVLASILTG